MASVEPPDVWYELSLPDECIDKGKLSALQLEAVTYSVSTLVQKCLIHNPYLTS